jgi:hypothetical protein
MCILSQINQGLNGKRKVYRELVRNKKTRINNLDQTVTD